MHQNNPAWILIIVHEQKYQACCGLDTLTEFSLKTDTKDDERGKSQSGSFSMINTLITSVLNRIVPALLRQFLVQNFGNLVCLFHPCLFPSLQTIFSSVTKYSLVSSIEICIARLFCLWPILNRKKKKKLAHCVFRAGIAADVVGPHTSSYRCISMASHDCQGELISAFYWSCEPAKN